MPPNLSISGSFWNCGAPPDSEIAVAIVSAPSRQATSIAANAAIQSAAPGRPANDPRLWKTTRVTVEMNAKLARLNATFTTDWRAVTSRATAEPTRTASRYSSGVTKNSPRTAGISLSENECVSRRKWTRMTFVSTARKADREQRPRNGERARHRPERAGRRRRRRCSARQARAAVNSQTRAADGRTCRRPIATTNRRHRDGTGSVPGLLDGGVWAGWASPAGVSRGGDVRLLVVLQRARGIRRPPKVPIGVVPPGLEEADLSSEGPLLPSPLHPAPASEPSRHDPTPHDRREDLGRPRRQPGPGRAGRPRRRPAPRPRGHLAAGVLRAPRPRPRRSATPSGPSRRPTTRSRPTRAACRWPTRWPRPRSIS